MRKADRFALDALRPLPLQIHELASELIRLKVDGQMEGATTQLPELHRLRDLLLAQLLKMVQQGRSEQGLQEHLSLAS